MIAVDATMCCTMSTLGGGAGGGVVEHATSRKRAQMNAKNLRVTLKACIVAATFLGCGEKDYFVLRIDPSFSPQQRDMILDSAALWHRETCGKFNYLPEIRRVTERRGSDLESGVIAFRPGSLEPPLSGVTHRDFSLFEKEIPRAAVVEIDYAATKKADVFLFVSQHELGHAIGLEHTRQGIMQPGGSELEPSDEDRFQARTTWCQR